MDVFDFVGEEKMFDFVGEEKIKELAKKIERKSEIHVNVARIGPIKVRTVRTTDRVTGNADGTDPVKTVDGVLPRADLFPDAGRP